MSSWSKRRKISYLLVGLFVAIVLIALPIFFITYKAPTCFDGLKNGDEFGIDCGGSCVRLCQNAFLSPSVAWTRFEQVAPGLYNIAAYIINPNIEGEALNVPYHLALYDKDGLLITDQKGTVNIPPHRNTIVFKGAVSTGKRNPVKALFEFTQAPDWHKKTDNLTNLKTVDKKYSEEPGLGSSLSVYIENTSVRDTGRLSVYVVLYDNDANAIGFSKTVIDNIPGKSIGIAPFTWPTDRNNKVVSIEVLPVAE